MTNYEREQTVVKQLHNLKGQKQALEGSLAKVTLQIDEMKDRETVLDESLVILNMAAERSREEIKSTVERVVTQTIRSIMESKEYNFAIVFEKKRNQIEARPTVDPPGGNVLDSKGGTILDIITTTLRLIIKELLNVSGPVIMDEPAKNIAETHRPNFIKMLKEFSYKTKTQVVMCSHEREYIREADAAIEVRRIEGRSTARVV